MVILMSFEDSECDDSPVTDGYAGTFQGGGMGRNRQSTQVWSKGLVLRSSALSFAGSNPVSVKVVGDTRVVRHLKTHSTGLA